MFNTQIARTLLVSFCASILLGAIAQAAPVSILSGNAHIQTITLAQVTMDKNLPISSFGTGSLDLNDPINKTSASMQWNLTSTDTSAIFDFALQTFAGNGGQGTAESTLTFHNNNPLHYNLLVNFPIEFGNNSHGDIDGTSIGFLNNIQNPPPAGSKSISGDLAPGDHTFSASSFSAMARSNPNRSDGHVTLSLTGAASIPLPAAFWPGMIMLVTIAGFIVRASQRRRITP